MDSYLGLLFCSTGLHVCFCASIMLFLLPCFCSTVWSWVFWYLQHCSLIQHINRSKDKNHDYLNRYRKNLLQNSTSFHYKSSDETRSRRNVPNRANIILNRKKLKPFPLKSGREKVSTLSTLNQHSLGIPSQSNKTGRRNKRITDQKERSQTIPICRLCDLVHKDPQNF
jgi:hypothetical protein